MNCAELAGPEERLDDGADGARVDQVVGGDVVSESCRLIRSRMMRAMRVRPTVELVGEQLAHRAHPAVAQVVDVVGGHVRMGGAQA